MTMELQCLQEYWWLLIAVLGAALVLMLFVQGGQTMLRGSRRHPVDIEMMVNSLGRKWELTFTTLVVFGGAFFASFPLFYSTSFGGAYWLWMTILFSFVLQAVSYEYRSKPGNLFGTRVYDTFLFINGAVGCILLGVAVAMMFFGAEFTVAKGNILDAASPVISRWAPTHGREAMVSWKNLTLGVAVLFLARTLAPLYWLNDIHGPEEFTARCRRSVAVNGVIFVVFFLGFLALLLTADGLEAVPVDGSLEGSHRFNVVSYKYLHNFIDMWWAGALFLVGVVAVLAGVAMGAGVVKGHERKAIWPAGAGVVVVVVMLFFVAGYNNTAYYPSLIDPSSSLTIYNSSSSLFTLKTMTWVSAITPFVIAYIIYVWRAMNRKPITPAEMESTSHKY